MSRTVPLQWVQTSYQGNAITSCIDIVSTVETLSSLQLLLEQYDNFMSRLFRVIARFPESSRVISPKAQIPRTTWHFTSFIQTFEPRVRFRPSIWQPNQTAPYARNTPLASRRLQRKVSPILHALDRLLVKTAFNNTERVMTASIGRLKTSS